MSLPTSKVRARAQELEAEATHLKELVDDGLERPLILLRLGLLYRHGIEACVGVGNTNDLATTSGKLDLADIAHGFATKLDRVDVIDYAQVLPVELNTWGTADNHMNRGHALLKTKELVMACDVFQKGITDYQRLWSTLELLDSGRAHFDQGELFEAAEMYERASGSFKEVLGPLHWLTLATENSLGVVYHKQCNFMKAETVLQRALCGYKHIADSVGAFTASCNLICVYNDQGKFKEAANLRAGTR